MESLIVVSSIVLTAVIVTIVIVCVTKSSREIKRNGIRMTGVITEVTSKDFYDYADHRYYTDVWAKVSVYINGVDQVFDVYMGRSTGVKTGYLLDFYLWNGKTSAVIGSCRKGPNAQ